MGLSERIRGSGSAGEWRAVASSFEHEDVKTLDPAVTEATRVFRVQRKTGPGGLDFMYEERKISLVCEDDKWVARRWDDMGVTRRSAG
jgi:hypothetical protein